jgi:hypothetical protein
MIERLQRRLVPIVGALGIVAATATSLAPRAGLASTHVSTNPVQTSPTATGHLSSARHAARPSKVSTLPRLGPRSKRSTAKIATSGSRAHFVNVDNALAVTGPRVSANPSATTVEQLATYQGYSHDAQFNDFHHGGTPPDTQVATNGSIVIEAVNTSLYVINHDGSNPAAYDLPTLWTPAMTAANALHTAVGSYVVSDPRIVFDTESGLWFMSILIYDDGLMGSTPGSAYSYIALASSTDGTASAWNETVMASQAGELLDQPGLGLSSDKVLSSSNNFDFTQPSVPFTGAQIWVANKSELDTGVAVHYESTVLNANAFGYAPAVSRTPSTNTAYLAWNASPFFVVDTVTNLPSASTSALVSEQGVDMGTSTGSPVPVTQPGTSEQLDAGSDRFENAIWQNNRLWVAANDGIQVNGLAHPQTALFLAEVDTSNPTYTLADPSSTPTVLYSLRGTSFVYPELALNSSGVPLISFSRGSSTLYMSGSAFAFDPNGTGTLLSAGVINGGAGTGYYSCSGCAGPAGLSRWGDYSGIAIDPSDPTNVWIATEYSATNPGGGNVLNWGTVLARLTIDLPTVTGISVSSGRTSGGTALTITGSNFDPASSWAIFRGAPAESVQWLDDHHLSVIAPPNSAGGAAVQATTADGTSASSATFTYVYPPARTGYWLVASDGGIFPFGDAINHSYGSTGNIRLNQPIVDMVPTATGNGYWMVASDGGIFPFGDAIHHSYGSTGNIRLNQPIVGMAATVSGNGYWLVASDGGIFPFGDALQHSYGSTGNIRLNQPIIGMTRTATGNGYWLVASDGGIFPFGDAVQHSYGSTGGTRLNKPIVGMAAMTGGNGYWLVASDGGIFPFGEAIHHSYGSTGNIRLNQPIVGMANTGDDGGYWLVASDGGLFPFGDGLQHSYGSTGNIRLNQPIVGMASLPN